MLRGATSEGSALSATWGTASQADPALVPEAPEPASSGPASFGPRRAYDASGRRADAERRRTRIAEEAARLFAERGWTGTTIPLVAREAGVSAELVSKAFGGKQGLFMAALAAAGFRSERTLGDALAVLRLEDEPDVEVRLDRFVDFACRVLVPMAPLVTVLATGADLDPRLRALVAKARDDHAALCVGLVDLLATGPVGPDAADEVCLLTRAETYQLLVDERGWSTERYAAWLRQSLRTAVDRPAVAGPDVR